MKVVQLHPTLCDPMDYTVHGILHPRILEWVAFPFSRGSSECRSSALQADSLPAEPQGKPSNTGVGSLTLLQQIIPTQDLNWGLLRCRWILYQLNYQGSPSCSMQYLNCGTWDIGPWPGIRPGPPALGAECYLLDHDGPDLPFFVTVFFCVSYNNWRKVMMNTNLVAFYWLAVMF